MSTLEEIYMELARQPSSGSFSLAVFTLVDRLIAESREFGIADTVVAASPDGIPWSHISDVLGIMIWSTSDNGAGISRDTERWLRECRDERRAFVALNLDTYPFHDPAEMESVLFRVGDRFPALVEQCNRLISSRNGGS